MTTLDATRAYGVQTLSDRELEVVRAWIDVGVNRLVATRLGISEQTVKNHVTSILRKLGVNSIGQAAIAVDRCDRGWPASWPDVDRRRGGDRRSGRERRGSAARVAVQ